VGFRDRLSHAWNAFVDDENREDYSKMALGSFGSSYGLRPDRPRVRISGEGSIISAIYTRLGVDVASVFIRHVRRDANGRFLEQVNSGLNECLTVEANLDQAATAFRQDMAMSLFDKGVIAVVPIDTSINPKYTGGYDIKTLRVGEVVGWYPKHVRVKIWNESMGRHDELTLPKRIVAIVENPLYAVMNEPNSILQRLIRKLQLLDQVDEVSASGKLDLIVQLPYVIKTEERRKQANARRVDIEEQLARGKYGIAYTDGSEKITQLNRPAENNMLKQVEFLTEQLYNQLGLTKSVFDGTADEATMLNYYNRTVEPVLRAICEALNRTFVTKTARTQGQAIDFSRDPFKLVPISQLADIADKFTRNEILSSNEIRAIVGFKPADDPKADQLVNSNMPQADPAAAAAAPADITAQQNAEQDALVDDMFKNLQSDIDNVLSEAGG
jgi:hypothetical protein